MENVIINGLKITFIFFMCSCAFFCLLYGANTVMPELNGFFSNLIVNALLASIGILLYMGSGFVALIFIGCAVYYINE